MLRGQGQGQGLGQGQGQMGQQLTGEPGEMSLLEQAQRRRREVLRDLIGARNNLGLTPLDLAARKGHAEVLVRLLPHAGEEAVAAAATMVGKAGGPSEAAVVRCRKLLAARLKELRLESEMQRQAAREAARGGGGSSKGQVRGEEWG